MGRPFYSRRHFERVSNAGPGNPAPTLRERIETWRALKASHGDRQDVADMCDNLIAEAEAEIRLRVVPPPRFRADVTISTETAQDARRRAPIRNVMGDLLRELEAGPKPVRQLRHVPGLLILTAASMRFIDRNAPEGCTLTDAGRAALASGRFDVPGPKENDD